MVQTIGIIGGSGIYAIEGFQQEEERLVSTPFGAPSAPLRIGTLGATRVVFLPRHGTGHTSSPSEIPFRANIYALKEAGVDAVLSISAVGSLKEELPPGTMVLPDQFIDRTTNRQRTFFTDGVVGHVAFGDPICDKLADQVEAAVERAGLKVVRGGTYVCIEGPQFSTRAESNLFRQWGATIIGMTNLPEARLAREAELPYATLALVTDYDCWHEEHDDVTVDQVIATLKNNVSKAVQVLRELTNSGLKPLDGSVAHGALEFAVMTHPNALSESARRRVELFMKPYWGDKE